MKSQNFSNEFYHYFLTRETSLVDQQEGWSLNLVVCLSFGRAEVPGEFVLRWHAFLFFLLFLTFTYSFLLRYVDSTQFQKVDKTQIVSCFTNAFRKMYMCITKN